MVRCSWPGNAAPLHPSSHLPPPTPHPHPYRVICSHLPPILCHYLLILEQDENDLLRVLDTAAPTGGWELQPPMVGGTCRPYLWVGPVLVSLPPLTDVDGLPVHLFPVYLTQEELALVAPPSRPDISQTYRRLRRVSSTHSARQSRRGGQRPSQGGSGGRSGQGTAARHGLSEAIAGMSLTSSQPRYEVVHITPARSSHVTGVQQEDMPHPACNTDQLENAAEEDSEILGQSHVEGNPPHLTRTSPTPSPSHGIGPSPPITISPRAKSTPPSHAALSVSPSAKSSQSGSGSYITPGHSSPDNLDRQNSLSSPDVSPDGYVFQTPQSSVSESRALFPQQDSSPPARQDNELKDQDGVHDLPQEGVPPAEATHQHRPEDRDEPQVCKMHFHLHLCLVLPLLPLPLPPPPSPTHTHPLPPPSLPP